MILKRVVLGITIGSFLVVGSGPQASADMRTKLILLGTAFVIGVMEGKGAEGARNHEPPKQTPNAPASQSSSHPPSSEPGPTTAERGTLYKLVGANAEAKAEYCISIFGRLCYPCDLEGNSCRVRQGEDAIHITAANTQ